MGLSALTSIAYGVQEENHGCSTAQLPAPRMCCDGVQSIPQPGHTPLGSSPPWNYCAAALWDPALPRSVPKLHHSRVALHLCPGVLMTNTANTAICGALMQGDKKCWLLSREVLFSMVHVNQIAQ